MKLLRVKKIKKLIKFILVPFYRIFNLLYFPFLKIYFFSKIEKVPRNEQLFFMTRFDFGTCLMMMHYAACWTRERGPCCIVVFTTHSSKVVKLSKLICPEVKLIHFNNWFSEFLFSIFRSEIIQFYTLTRIYAYACCRWPYALYIYEMAFCRRMRENVSHYVAALDPILQMPWVFSSDFLDAYLKLMNVYDCRRVVFKDIIRLHYQACPKAIVNRSHLSENKLRSIIKSLKIRSPYVVMNLNCKVYSNKTMNNRRINHPERYNLLIDFLIERGYSVVLQGRDEQPHLPDRENFVQYFKSPYISPENDYHIFSGSAFAVFPKTGPEMFGAICHLPILGLNYTELSHVMPNGRCRFFPKHLWDSKKDRFVHWKDLLRRPCFFDIGHLAFEEGIEYMDLDEDEMIQAAVEFLELLSKKPSEPWWEYTPLQEEFRSCLHPANLDLYDIKDVPCDAYLSSWRYK